ncbi:glycerophosphodiester phosphodiesterase family protein [Sphingobacterium bovistauri]|uniref:Glycerophosphodiester phosphodiesterase family protein n=1 Tax=Sphingobacterium bovistauri TaxID=2781959 RepID=A0ABS7Z936_9SPHI|nr:glycerophosphodiester phosphodiesterase family protein [Sphingobacterium bovistauri]MCA5006057.1 glycerophosphodiester phosphodiesterase family protein [Sphingobacterium bovistauri]
MKKILNSIAFAISFIVIVGCFRNTPPQSQQDTVTSKSNYEKSLFSSSNFNINSLDDLYEFLTYSEKRVPLVSAHRGGDTQGYPENAIETFEYWAKQFPLIIECDVRMSKDSVLVLMHDETLDRTSNGSGSINSYSLEDLKKIRLKDSNGELTEYKIPTLEEALVWGKGNVIFTLDVKQDVPYKLLNQIIQKTNAQSYAVVITYNSNQARAINRINPDLMLSVSIKSQKDLAKLAEAGIPDNRLIAFVGTSQPKTELIDLLHSHGIKTILGTIGNLDKQTKSRGYQVYAEYIENGADILSTDRPEEAQKALDFFIKKRKLESPFLNR